MKDFIKKIKPELPLLVAIAGGAILPFGLAPYSYAILGLISPAILLWLLAKVSVKRAFVLGYLYGLGLFGAGIYWVYFSIHDYGNASPLLAGILTGLFIAVLALFPAACAAVLNRFFPRNDSVRCLLAYPALWVVFEMLRGWVLTGFPWAYVGYTQIGNHLNAFAPIGSVFAVSWVSVFISGLLYQIVDYFYFNKENKKFRNKIFIALVATWACAFGLSQITWILVSDKGINVALVQGSIPQEMRWDEAKVKQIIGTYEKLTGDALKAAPKPNLIIWPEGAIPMSAQGAAPFLKQLDTAMEAQKTGLITGIPWANTNGQFYNSLIAFGYATTGVYHKKHLVPFGEYVPLEKLLRGLIDFFDLPMSNFIDGPDKQELIESFHFKIAPAICYEIAYPTLVQQISQHADFILTLSNDTWFGTSIGPAQHLEIARFRALETQKYVVRATNTGFTALINPDASIQVIANQFEPTVLYGGVARTQGQTFWSRFGIWPLLAALGVALSLAYFLASRKKD